MVEIVTFDEFLRRASERTRGAPSKVLRVPIWPFVQAHGLRAVEAMVPVRLSLTAGQFASFLNDGVTCRDPRLDPLHRDMLGVDVKGLSN